MHTSLRFPEVQVSAAAGVSPASSDLTGWHLYLEPLERVVPPAGPRSALVQRCCQSLPAPHHSMYVRSLVEDGWRASRSWGYVE